MVDTRLPSASPFGLRLTPLTFPVGWYTHSNTQHRLDFPEGANFVLTGYQNRGRADVINYDTDHDCYPDRSKLYLPESGLVPVSRRTHPWGHRPSLGTGRAVHTNRAERAIFRRPVLLFDGHRTMLVGHDWGN